MVLGDKYRTGCAADRTGHAMLHTLYGQSPKPDCQYFIEYLVLDLIQGKCMGVTALSMEHGTLHRIFTRNTVLATGDKYKTTAFILRNNLLVSTGKCGPTNTYFVIPCFIDYL